MSHSTDIILEPSTTAVTFTDGSSSQVTVTHAITEVILEDGSTTQLISGVVIDNRLYYDLAFTAAQEYSDEQDDLILDQANEYTDTGLSNKVDKVLGKQLSTEDYSTVEKAKLAGIATGATANPNSPNSLTTTGSSGAATLVSNVLNVPNYTAEGLGAELSVNKGLANGYASLDGGGKVPVAQLPSSLMEYKGTWDAATNTPTLANGIGDTGDVYRVSVAGTQFGIDFGVGDYAIYNGSIWEKSDTTDSVATVFGRTGNVTAQTGDYSISQITGASTVASSGSFSDLLNQSALFNLVYSAYVIGSNIAIAATDTVGEMLGKLQAQINNKEPSIDSGTTAQYWRGDKTWRSFATDVLNTVLTGFSASTATPVTATDNNLIAIGKLQAQINALSPSLGGGLTFNQSRWTFTDFDSGVNSSSIFHAGYIMGSIAAGTRVGIAGGVGTQGILRFISAAAVNTGFQVSNASAVPNLHIRPLQGSCCLFVAAIPYGGSSRLLTIGFDATTNWSVVPLPANSVHARFTISSFTVSASCRRSVVGNTTTQGSTVLTGDTYHVFLVQYVADDQVRFVIWDLLTNVKVFDETIVTDTPTTATGAILFHGVHATGSGTQPLVDIDYIGRGIELPPYFVIPS